MSTQDMRREFVKGELFEADAVADPIEQFGRWFDDARKHVQGEWFEANAMTLCTTAADGTPAGRIVLLKDFDAAGFVFYTNYASAKGRELAANPVASLVFYWGELERQVRITGAVSKVSEAESEAYFRTRPHDSQLGAAASNQSGVVESRDELERRLEALRQRHPEGGDPVPRPATWGGYRVAPDRVEFWQGRPSRLHDRLLYTRAGDREWSMQRLEP